MEPTLKRCFIALELSREAINEIKRIQKLLEKQRLFAGKFTEPENLHLTLKFLGEISNEKIEEVKNRLKEIKIDKFNAELGEVGVFSKSFVKIIWIKLNGKVFGLQKEIDEKLKDLFEKEERFMSHVTIARVKNTADKKKLFEYLESINPSKISFKVEKFYLKKSELTSEGPVYEDIKEYELV